MIPIFMHTGINMKATQVLLSCLLAVATGNVAARDTDPPEAFSVCFDFNCKNSQDITLSRSDWTQVTGIFLLNGDSGEERTRIKEAVAVLEELVGKYAPTYRDVGKNWPASSSSLVTQSGQMDCIDESINTTTYLNLLAEAGLLKYHLVRNRAVRRSIFVKHWAAQIVDTQTGQHYVVDSWFRDNGELPYLVKGEAWHDLSRF